MFKSIDKESADEIEGFSYTNADDEKEYVELDWSYVILKDGSGSPLDMIYYKDIPKMILALQAAYEHNLKEKQND